MSPKKQAVRNALLCCSLTEGSWTGFSASFAHLSAGGWSSRSQPGAGVRQGIQVWLLLRNPPRKGWVFVPWMGPLGVPPAGGSRCGKEKPEGGKRFGLRLCQPLL